MLSAKETVSLNLGSSFIDLRAWKEFVLEFQARGGDALGALGGVEGDALLGDVLKSRSSITFLDVLGVAAAVPFGSGFLEPPARALTEDVTVGGCLTRFTAGAADNGAAGSFLCVREDDDERPACGRCDASVIGVNGVLSGGAAARSKLKGGSWGPGAPGAPGAPGEPGVPGV